MDSRGCQWGGMDRTCLGTYKAFRSVCAEHSEGIFVCADERWCAMDILGLIRSPGLVVSVRGIFCSHRTRLKSLGTCVCCDEISSRSSNIHNDQSIIGLGPLHSSEISIVVFVSDPTRHVSQSLRRYKQGKEK